MLTFISIIKAEFLAFYYSGEVIYHHINKHNQWEFIIVGTYRTLYRSKGLR
jgi:hypothetical protein